MSTGSLKQFSHIDFMDMYAAIGESVVADIKPSGERPRGSHDRHHRLQPYLHEG